MGGKFKREGTYVYLRLIHLDVWQKSTQYCKSIVLQLKINKYLKKKKSICLGLMSSNPRLRTSNAGGPGSTPGQGSKSPHTAA